MLSFVCPVLLENLELKELGKRIWVLPKRLHKLGKERGDTPIYVYWPNRILILVVLLLLFCVCSVAQIKKVVPLKELLLVILELEEKVPFEDTELLHILEEQEELMLDNQGWTLTLPGARSAPRPRKKLHISWRLRFVTSFSPSSRILSPYLSHASLFLCLLFVVFAFTGREMPSWRCH